MKYTKNKSCTKLVSFTRQSPGRIYFLSILTNNKKPHVPFSPLSCNNHVTTQGTERQNIPYAGFKHSPDTVCRRFLVEHASDYTLITNLMHWLLFIRKILLSSTCFKHQSAHLQEDIVVYKQHMVPSLSIRVLVACWYAAIAAYQQATRTLIESDGTICCLYTTMSSWRWALDARNM